MNGSNRYPVTLRFNLAEQKQLLDLRKDIADTYGVPLQSVSGKDVLRLAFNLYVQAASQRKFQEKRDAESNSQTSNDSGASVSADASSASANTTPTDGAVRDTGGGAAGSEVVAGA